MEKGKIAVNLIRLIGNSDFQRAFPPLLATGAVLYFFIQPLFWIFVCFLLIILIIIFSTDGDVSIGPEKELKERAARAEKELKERIKEKSIARAEEERRNTLHRDAPIQTTPYRYNCKGHPNNTLAIRYGVANCLVERDSYDHKKMTNIPNDTILLQKIEKFPEPNEYRALLPDFGNKEVRVVIERNTDYVKTFLPLDKDWFDAHPELERALKDNPTFDLKEQARFHVLRLIKGA